MEKLLKEIRACHFCKEHLPLAPRPILNFTRESRIMIVGQAPGARVHETGIPWNDPSGDRLRQWMGVDREVFYDPKVFAIVPMGFCYPGKGRSGDLPPRPECADLWMGKILSALEKVELTLLIGQYSQAHFLKNSRKTNLTETVRAYEEYLPQFMVLPHPSPRNNIWLKKNQWFEQTLIPQLRRRIHPLIFSKNRPEDFTKTPDTKNIKI